MSEIEFRIAEILGRSAIENDMEVPKDVQQLAQATRMLTDFIERGKMRIT